MKLVPVIPLSLHRPFVIKTLLALLVPVIFFFLVGCVPAEEEPVDYGEKVDPTTIQKAMSDAAGPLDFLEIRNGEYSERYVKGYSGGREVTQYGSSFEVTEKTEYRFPENCKVEAASPDVACEYIILVFTGIASSVEYDAQGKPQNENRTELADISVCAFGECPQESEAAPRALTPLSFSADFSLLSSEVDTVHPTSGPTYHNLKVVRTVEEPPRAVREATDCGGLSPCELNTVQVTYDSVLKTTDGQTILVQNEWVTSADLPFFSRTQLTRDGSGALNLYSTPLRVCQSYASGAQIIKACEELTDFRTGVE